MALSWSPWILLNTEQLQKLAPRTSGLYEVKVDNAVIDYPNGKSSMVYYGSTNQELPTLFEAINQDWMTPDKSKTRKAWEPYGTLVWRFAVQNEPQIEHSRRLESFIQRFGRPPWANPTEKDSSL